MVAGFRDDGTVQPPTDPRARRYLTIQQTDAAINWIKQQQDAGTPWMATLSYSVAHLPAQQPHRDLIPNAFDRGGDACGHVVEQRFLTNKMVEGMDREIGRLLVEIDLATRNGDELDYRPELTDTMVVIVGDNGSYLQTVRAPFDFTRAKGTVYQTGVWVPLIAAGPLVDSGNVGAEVPHMVNAAVDVFALFGEVAGLDVRQEVPRSRALDARPLLPYLTNPGQRSLRQTNFTQTGTVLKAGEGMPCVLPLGQASICIDIFTFAELCETEGGTPFPDLPSCCAVQKEENHSDVQILPRSAWAIRDEQFKLVRTDTENCTTGLFEIAHEFYEINENAPLPELDRAGDNLLLAPTLPPQGLTGPQRARFNKLKADLDALLRSETECPGDGNLDKRVDREDLANWQVFADRCLANEGGCRLLFELGLPRGTGLGGTGRKRCDPEPSAP